MCVSCFLLHHATQKQYGNVAIDQANGVKSLLIKLLDILLVVVAVSLSSTWMIYIVQCNLPSVVLIASNGGAGRLASPERIYLCSLVVSIVKRRQFVLFNDLFLSSHSKDFSFVFAMRELCLL